MRHRIPRQFIILIAILVITCASLVYVYSCREKIFMRLDTFEGDTQSLSDRQMNLRLASTGYTNHSSILNLALSFDGNPVLERVAYDQETRQAVREGRLDLTYQDGGESRDYDFQVSITGQPETVLTGLDIADNSATLLTDVFSQFEDATLVDHFIGYTGSSPELIEINGIIYFTIPNLKYTPFTFYVETMKFTKWSHYALPDPVQYTAQSGIWAIRTDGGLAENVVPLTISSDPESPKVYTIYPVEEKDSIILLTVENGVDLYATLYNTKTSFAHDPVLVFHSESGEINPIQSRKNATCPMGSIIVEVQGEKSKCFAVAIGRDEENGRLTSQSYDITEILNTRWTEVSGIYQFVDYSDDYAFREYSEIFYMGEELWIISSISDKYDDEIITLDSPAFPFSSQSMQQFRIEGCKSGDVFYRGVLSIDLSAADLDAVFFAYDPFIVYGQDRNTMNTWVEFS